MFKPPDDPEAAAKAEQESCACGRTSYGDNDSPLPFLSGYRQGNAEHNETHPNNPEV